MKSSESNYLLRNPIIDQISELVDGIPGWTPIDELYTLYLLAMSFAKDEGDILEIGSWCGRSTLVLALAARNIGDKKVYAFDLFPNKNDWEENKDGSFSFKVKIKNQLFNGYKEQTVWEEPF